MDEIYRLRSVDRLLGDRVELARQTIYFAEGGYIGWCQSAGDAQAIAVTPTDLQSLRPTLRFEVAPVPGDA